MHIGIIIVLSGDMGTSVGDNHILVLSVVLVILASFCSSISHLKPPVVVVHFEIPLEYLLKYIWS